jgi:hypothetical protein
MDVCGSAGRGETGLEALQGEEPGSEDRHLEGKRKNRERCRMRTREEKRFKKKIETVDRAEQDVERRNRAKRGKRRMEGKRKRYSRKEDGKSKT